MTFGKRLKELRLKKNLTQKELGEKLNISDRVIGYYESDDRFPKDEKILKDMAELFNVSMDYLLGGDKLKESTIVIPEEFTNPEDARKYVGMHTIFGSGGFRPERMSDEEIVEFANELLRQMEMVSYKYKK